MACIKTEEGAVYVWLCSGDSKIKWSKGVGSLTFAITGCQDSRHRDFALLTSLVFCSKGQLTTWVCINKTDRSVFNPIFSRTQNTTEDFHLRPKPAPQCSTPPQNRHSWTTPETNINKGLRCIFMQILQKTQFASKDYSVNLRISR